MTVPPSMLSDGHVKNLASARYALEQRIMNATNRVSSAPSYHRGSPDPRACPDEALGIWLDWTSINRDPDEPYEATMFVSAWKVFILTRDENGDAFGQLSTLGEQVWSDIVTSLTQTVVDLGLDGSCDVVDTPEAAHGHGNISGGDRLVDAIEVTLMVRHTMVPRTVPQQTQ